MKKPLIALFFTLFSLISNAQLTGKITDSKGDNLPFANVYLEGTTRGTTANTEGSYFFDIPDGTYRVVYQLIGYKKRIESVVVSGKTKRDVVLEILEQELAEIVIKSNAEDPAYPIIRKAIENRSYFLKQVKSYSCDVYIKGLQRIEDAPKKIFGQKIGDMDGSLDTITRSGIVYLAETLSKLHVSADDVKEELITSKISGDDKGFAFNRATLFDFNLYKNLNNDLSRKILSPIAENALANYRYKLVSSSRIDEQNIYKIEVIPLRKEDPTWNGYIYIVDNQWNIYATDLFLTGKNLQQDIVDTVRLQQNYVKLNQDVWRIFSQRLDFRIKILSFRFHGYFSGVFSNYNLTPQYPPKFFNNETFTALKATQTNDLKKWETIRPIPLTLDEIKDYRRKDSIQAVRTSKPYMDSVMRRRNRFAIGDLLLGYTYRNPYKATSIGFGSVLTALNFNAVQGLNFTLPLNYTKEFKDSLFMPTKSTLNLSPSVNYSVGEKRIRSEFSGSYLFNNFNRAQLSLSFGQKVAQFNDNDIVSPAWAMYQALYEKRHIYFLYEKTFAKIAFSREIANGFRGNISLEAAQRDPLSISTQYSFQKKDDVYARNEPILTKSSDGFPSGKIVLANVNLTWTPHQKYTTYPFGKFNEAPRFPIFSLRYQQAFGNGTTEFADFSKLKLGIKQESISVGLLGYSEIKAEFGIFLSKKQLLFMDNTHFNGNELGLAETVHLMDGFFDLPYYKYSTIDNYVTAHWQHHFDGYFLSKIPLIRKLGFREILRVAYLNTPNVGNYGEVGVGLDNIGFGLFRILRLDLSWVYRDGKMEKKPIWMFGVNLPLGN